MGMVNGHVHGLFAAENSDGWLAGLAPRYLFIGIAIGR